MLVPAACLALLAVAPDVESKGQLELQVRGDFVLASPGKAAKFKASGPGKLVAYVVARARPDEELPGVDLEVVSAGESLFKDHLTTSRIPGLATQGPRTDFVAGGLKRISFELAPKSRTYEFRPSAPAAIAVYRVVQAPPGVKVPEVPVKAEGKAKTWTFAGKEKWNWASICEHVSVSVPQSGTLKVWVRTQLGGLGDLPPPTFLRALSDGKVRAAFPITSAPETGVEFVSGGSHYGAGTLRPLTVRVSGQADYEFELAAWGCINGVGLQFDFEPGPPPSASEAAPLVSAAGLGGRAAPMVSNAQLPGVDGGLSGEQMAQCGLQLDDLSRARALEYLDTMVASGVIPASQLALVQDNQLGESFSVQSVWYALDGSALFQKEAPEPSAAPLAQRRVVPGPHTLEMKISLRGKGTGPFSYLNEYVIRLAKRESFVAESGKKYGLKVTLLDKGGFSTPFKDRPGVKVELVPER